MRKRVLLVVPAMLAVVGLCNGATITWGNVATPAVDFAGNLLLGQIDWGVTPNLSLGALVQLWKAVGAVDDPRLVEAAYNDTGWKIDDVLLDESHVGFGTFMPTGYWSHTGDYAVNEGDIVYVRAYKQEKPNFAATAYLQREIGIRDVAGNILTATVGDVKNPQSLYFEGLKTEPIPEPACLLFLVPGLALWAVRRKK